MKFTSAIALVLLSTVVSTLASPIDKRAADAATQKANGDDAIALNNQFATMKVTDPCTSGQKACIGGAFAQCVNNKWSTTPCAGGTQCFALPLVNSRGTSLTCDTPADKDARIAAAEGNSGGGGGAATPAAASPTPAAASPAPAAASPAPAAASPATKPKKNKKKNKKGKATTAPAAAPAATTAPAAAPAATTAPAAAPATSPTPAAGSGDIASIRKQNAIDAQAQQDSFNSLNANSPCTNGQNACVNNQFAQCSGGKFAMTPCSGGTQCFALPLVNKSGTSVTCDTQADRDARFAAAQKGQS